MDLFQILAVLISLTALFSYVNHRYIGLPITIGVMLIALVLSLMLNLLDLFGLNLKDSAEHLLNNIDFDDTLLHGMLSFLLFAGALHINIDDLFDRKWIIGSLATFGVLLSTFIIGTITWLCLGLFGFQMPYVYCLLFGSLISPTDPIAVISILKSVSTPRSLEVKIAGESLFNDGVGVVVFIVILQFATGNHAPHAGQIVILFVQEAIGGALFGLAVGYLAYRMLKSLDNYQVEVLITLALVTGGFALADLWHLSGPIAIVVAGLFIGNRGRLFAMSDETRHRLDTFWELVDEILNAVLFLMIGIEILIITFTKKSLLVSLLMIPIVLIARFISIGIPITLHRPFRTFSPGAVRVMTWGGIRGGISVALALSLPSGPERDLILIFTYVVVLFSILVQGLTIDKVVKKLVEEIR